MRSRTKEDWVAIIIVSLIAFGVLGLVGKAHAEPDYAKLCDVIYRIEGGEKTLYPYGIRSIDTHGNKAKARRICLNTVRNTYKRWIVARNSSNSEKRAYIDYLADRYCPPSADKQGNINWKANIKRLYRGGV